MGKGRVPLETGDDVASEVGVLTCKLICKCGEDVLELSSFNIIPGTEKASTKEFIIGNGF